MSESVPAVNSFEIGLASGCLGAGVGYVLAPRKYNLEQLLTQDSVEFQNAVPKKFIKKKNIDLQNAYNTIVKAREDIVNAFKSNTGEAKLVEYIRTPKYIEAYKHIKRLIPHARIQTAIISGLVAGVAAVFVRIFSDKESYQPKS